VQKNSENESVVGLLMIGFWSFMVQLGVAVRWKYTAYVNISVGAIWNMDSRMDCLLY